MTSSEQKRVLRSEQRRRLAIMPTEDRERSSLELRCRLLAESVWNEAATVLAFAARHDEPDLDALLKTAISEGRTVLLPRFHSSSGRYEIAVVADWSRDLVPGEFGILEPRRDAPLFPLKQLDLVLVPGLAFDAKGARLGRGKGFYDRLLADVSGHLCGVLFESQLVGEVPLEPHDRLMNSILTPTSWRLAAGRAGILE